MLVFFALVVWKLLHPTPGLREPEPWLPAGVGSTVWLTYFPSLFRNSRERISLCRA